MGPSCSIRRPRQALVLAVGLIAGGRLAAQDLPEVIVDRDDVRVSRSSRIVVPKDTVIEDSAGDGVIQVVAEGVVLEFAAGSVLRGAPAGSPGDGLSGVGVRLVGVEDVTLRGARIQGFRAGVWATGSHRLMIEDAELSDLFRQRLGSTPLAEDGGDWLWPHRNEDNEWLRDYGAAIYLEDCEGVVVRGTRVRRSQNGIVLDRIEGGEIYDNDCSFLSGWGLAMWRSSGNTISRNAFDFCVRGYSHGVYNRGQDSAGILMFEQCCGNVIAENSVTHGGDGLFGFAGREALGEDGDHPVAWYRRRGNNDNLLIGNDFSYAPAHGIEMTFSFGNRIVGNRLVGNAICGIWGGFSQDSLIVDNEIADNGGAGYGLERGGVNIDRSRGNVIAGNRFRGNRCGVHLWSLPTGFGERPWGQANDLRATGTEVFGNVFDGDQLVLHLRGECGVAWGDNELVGVGEERRLEGGATVAELVEGELPLQPSLVRLPGRTRPVGARPELRGRENIVIGPWGPWDHSEPLLLPREAGPGFLVYQGFPARQPLAVEMLEGTSPAVVATEERTERGESLIRLEATAPGLHRYRAILSSGDTRWPVEGWLLAATWTVRFFSWSVDPREDLEAWRAQAGAGVEVEVGGLALHFDHGGPADLGLGEAIRGAGVGADRFGTVARATLALPAGRYRLKTLSDDGIRVLVDDAVVLEDWSWHSPKEDVGEFELLHDRSVEIRVEHFEIDGFAKLVLALERLD